MPLHTIVEHDTTHIKPYIDHLKQTLTDEAETRAQLGAHNLLPVVLEEIKALNTGGTWSGNSYVYKGITFTVNDDLTVTANGTSTGEWVTFKISNALYLNAGEYILSGNIGGETTTYRLTVEKSGVAFVNLDGETAVDISAYDRYEVNITVRLANVTVNNQKFYPMLRLATDIDSTFAPYAMTNKELTEEVNVEAVTINVTNGTVHAARTHGEKFGHIVTISAHINSVTDINSDWTTVATVSIPPAKEFIFPVAFNKGTIMPLAIGIIDTSGNVKIAGAGDAVGNGTVQFNCSYFVN